MASAANLIFALLFLAVAIGVFVFEAMNPGQGVRIRGTNVSLAWLALLFFFYNLVRWCLWRSGQRTPRPPRPRPHEERSRQEEYLPEFDFSKDAEKKDPS